MTERELRSNSVTLLAWVFIILAALMTLIGATQNVLLHWFFPNIVAQLNNDFIGAPPLARFLAAHLKWIIGLFTLLSTLLFVSAVGVLHRHDWARKLFIRLLIIGLLWKVLSLVLMTLFMAELPLARATPFNNAIEVENFQTLMIGFNALLTIAIGAVLIRICHYLSLPKVTVEFGSLGEIESVAKYVPKEMD
ncbi:hypothetical protein [Saccharospirillum mangrovi]|uniref:hypothetical protein n=1 Tax=Saccharospirillum mangrovi TaxID=2161747 RepID=UPI000D36A491|nr:hypothetical protein [Saccharospirillum mangrovi]